MPLRPCLDCGTLSPENLELWLTQGGKHRKGQRVEDIVNDCVEQLQRYAPHLLSVVAGPPYLCEKNATDTPHSTLPPQVANGSG